MTITFFLFRTILYFCYFFFFNDTATTEIYTLSLHDALPISYEERLCPEKFLRNARKNLDRPGEVMLVHQYLQNDGGRHIDRKSTRLNSSHSQISYAVFCLKKKKIKMNIARYTRTAT